MVSPTSCRGNLQITKLRVNLGEVIGSISEPPKNLVNVNSLQMKDETECNGQPPAALINQPANLTLVGFSDVAMNTDITVNIFIRAMNIDIEL